MVSKARGNMHDCDAIAIHLFNKLWHKKPYPKLSTVRRNLFGFYEKNKNAGQLLDKQITDMAVKSSQVWNFDFLNELPKSGRYVWQRVYDCDVPIWYAATSRSTLKDSRRQKDEESLNGEDCCATPAHEKEDKVFDLESSKKDCLRRFKKPCLVQTSMKDFTRVQKKLRSSCRLRLKRLDGNKMQRLCCQYPTRTVTQL